MELIEKYLGEGKKENIKKAQVELAKLRNLRQIGRLTDKGQRRLEKLEDMLAKIGIFD